MLLCSLAGFLVSVQAGSGHLMFGHLQLGLQGTGMAQPLMAAGSTERSRLPRLRWGHSLLPCLEKMQGGGGEVLIG